MTPSPAPVTLTAPDGEEFHLYGKQAEFALWLARHGQIFLQGDKGRGEWTYHGGTLKISPAPLFELRAPITQHLNIDWRATK